MNIELMSSVLFVKDIETSKKFYTQVLKQEIIMDFGKNVSFEAGFAIWEISADHIISRNWNKKAKTEEGRFELYFETADIKETESQLKEAGVNFLHPIIEEPWGQQTLRFFDPDNHLIEIGETLESFVKRFHASGMTADEISARTSIPSADIKKILKTK